MTSDILVGNCNGLSDNSTKEAKTVFAREMIILHEFCYFGV